MATNMSFVDGATVIPADWLNNVNTVVNAGGAGTVTTVSVASANGFSATVATPTTTPVITMKTTITGLLKGNATAISAAVAGTDYSTPSSTDTLTNKTFDTAGAGNSFSINGVVATANSGTGAVVRVTSPALVTPALGTPTSGTLSSCTVDGTNGVGFINIPQNSQSSAYGLVLADAGKHIYHPSADTTARIWTIPANASVAYPIGTALTFVNDTSAGAITIAITTDTLVFAGAGTTGSRTLAASGIATAIKITSTRWIISGTGLT